MERHYRTEQAIKSPKTNMEERDIRFDDINTNGDTGISDGMPTAMTTVLAVTMTEISSE
jgi:hypothetical protein